MQEILSGSYLEYLAIILDLQYCNFYTSPAHSKLETMNHKARERAVIDTDTLRATIAIGKINTGKTKKLVKWKN